MPQGASTPVAHVHAAAEELLSPEGPVSERWSAEVVQPDGRVLVAKVEEEVKAVVEDEEGGMDAAEAGMQLRAADLAPINACIEGCGIEGDGPTSAPGEDSDAIPGDENESVSPWLSLGSVALAGALGPALGDSPCSPSGDVGRMSGGTGGGMGGHLGGGMGGMELAMGGGSGVGRNEVAASAAAAIAEALEVAAHAASVIGFTT